MSDSKGPSGRGAWVVAAIVLLAAFLATFALWFQWRQTRRCLAFYGPDAAGRIQAADHVELWDLGPGAEPAALGPLRSRDISGAQGLVHLRRGLVEDANFSWAERPPGSPPDRGWDIAIAFGSGSPPDDGRTVLVIDLDAAGGVIAVAGRTGELRLGRLGPALRTWLADVRESLGP
jgi:hypothetical protein